MQHWKTFSESRPFNFRFFGTGDSKIGKSSAKSNRWLRESDGYWMIKLNTLEPYGLNGINEYERIVRKSGLRNMFDMDTPGES